MTHRFYCPELVEAGAVTLVETEAHHLAHVLRHLPGDTVELFNGEGLVSSCRVDSVRKRDVQLEVLDARREDPPQVVVTLATAVPKGDRFDWLVEKCTELGVSRLIPLTTLRSVVDPRASKLDKLRQTVISACKQSGRNRLMEILSVTAWSDFVNRFGHQQSILIAHPGGISLSNALASRSVDRTNPIVVAIGPEGGFSDDEIQLALDCGAHAVQLGINILRVETAAIALAAKLLM